ncbi:MAG: DUF2911 domain-containing protein [Aurantibacter sp.]
MKHLYKSLMLSSLAILFLGTTTMTAQLDLPRGSQMAKVSQKIGITDVTIVYSRPSVNDREIWGKLVPYGMNNLGFGTAKESPWRAGANENTVIKFTDNVKIEGKDLAAGKYGLHMVVHENGKANIIFSKNHGAWGSYFYDPSEDALQVEVDTKEAPHTEQLTFVFNDVDASSAVAALNWEKKQIPFKIEVAVSDLVLADIRQKLQNTPGFNRQSWEQAAGYALNNGGDLDEALGWADNAIAGQFYSQKTFNNLGIKAGILTKQGKTEEADKIMEEALAMGTVFEIHGYGRQLIGQGQKDKALAIFKKNAKVHKDSWPVDYGLARAYSATGDYKTALKHLKVAQGRAPSEAEKNNVAANIAKLENNEDIN